MADGERREYKPGDSVECRWPSDNDWHPATVKAITKEGWIEVLAVVRGFERPAHVVNLESIRPRTP